MHPIVLVNTRDFFTPLVKLLEHAISERFMDQRHLQMWQLVATPADVPAALANPHGWSTDAREFATVL